MGRPRNPERNKSLQRYLNSNGEITIAELARLASVPEARIRRWKSEDGWDAQLQSKPKRRGGQKGNRNAAGKTPAKKGNKNAVTHGAYVQAGYGDIAPKKAAEIQQSQPKALPHMMDELKALYVRKVYLESLLTQYEAEDACAFYSDKIVHMIVPKSVEERQKEEDMGMKTHADDPEGAASEYYKTAMKSIMKSSPFERAMKVEAELNKLHGRIIKQLDSIKAYEMEDRRLVLEEKKYSLAKQKLTGEIEIDNEEEEIIDRLIGD